jgi:rhomboid family GlyGly-CTERM serine protease
MTLVTAALAIAATIVAPPALVASADGIARGELWRLVSGPLIHTSAQHLLWDVSILLALGLAYERRAGAAWRLSLGLGLVVPTAAVLAADPRLAAYYGTSGATHALMATALGWELLRGNRRWPVLLLTALFVVKLVRGTIGAAPLIDVPLGDGGLREAPLAHLVGAALGLLALAPFFRLRRRATAGAARW